MIDSLTYIKKKILTAYQTLKNTQYSRFVNVVFLKSSIISFFSLIRLFNQKFIFELTKPLKPIPINSMGTLRAKTYNLIGFLVDHSEESSDEQPIKKKLRDWFSKIVNYSIILSIICILLELVFDLNYSNLEKFILMIFSFEYFIKFLSFGKSYWKGCKGIIDAIATFPSLLTFLFEANLTWVRFVRLTRFARIFKLLNVVGGKPIDFLNSLFKEHKTVISQLHVEIKLIVGSLGLLLFVAWGQIMDSCNKVESLTALIITIKIFLNISNSTECLQSDPSGFFNFVGIIYLGIFASILAAIFIEVIQVKKKYRNQLFFNNHITLIYNSSYTSELIDEFESAKVNKLVLFGEKSLKEICEEKDLFYYEGEITSLKELANININKAKTLLISNLADLLERKEKDSIGSLSTLQNIKFVLESIKNENPEIEILFDYAELQPQHLTYIEDLSCAEKFNSQIFKNFLILLHISLNENQRKLFDQTIFSVNTQIVELDKEPYKKLALDENQVINLKKEGIHIELNNYFIDLFIENKFLILSDEKRYNEIIKNYGDKFNWEPIFSPIENFDEETIKTFLRNNNSSYIIVLADSSFKDQNEKDMASIATCNQISELLKKEGLEDQVQVFVEILEDFNEDILQNVLSKNGNSKVFNTYNPEKHLAALLIKAALYPGFISICKHFIENNMGFLKLINHSNFIKNKDYSLNELTKFSSNLKQFFGIYSNIEKVIKTDFILSQDIPIEETDEIVVIELKNS